MPEPRMKLLKNNRRLNAVIGRTFSGTSLSRVRSTVVRSRMYMSRIISRDLEPSLNWTSFWFCCRMFGSSGVCGSCGNAIPANELVMRAGDAVFHLKCFNCNKCGSQLVSGDR